MPTTTSAPRPRGRPPGSPNKKKSPPKPVVAKPITIAEDKDLNKLPKIYKCIKCGKMTLSAQNKFYKSGLNNATKGNDGFGFFCKDCCETLFNEYKAEYGSEKLALFLTCLHTNHYFHELLYETMAGRGESIKLGVYLRQLNQAQYSGKTIVDNFLELFDKQRLFLSDEDVQDQLEGNWKQQDRKNLTRCVRLLGYDPFADSAYTNNDRKFLFNSLAGYLNDEAVMDDPHKVQCIINIVKMLQQINVIEMKIVGILRATNPDNNALKSYTDSMIKLQQTVNSVAKANGISQEGSRGGNAVKSFTGTIRQVFESGILEAKNNFVDMRLADAYQSIAQISSRALIDELNFTSDEYAKMVADQSEIITKRTDEILKLKEELRLAKVELETIKNAKKYKRVPFVDNEIYDGYDGESDLIIEGSEGASSVMGDMGDMGDTSHTGDADGEEEQVMDDADI